MHWELSAAHKYIMLGSVLMEARWLTSEVRASHELGIAQDAVMSCSPIPSQLLFSHPFPTAKADEWDLCSAVSLPKSITEPPQSDAYCSVHTTVQPYKHKGEPPNIFPCHEKKKADSQLLQSVTFLRYMHRGLRCLRAKEFSHQIRTCVLNTVH